MSREKAKAFFDLVREMREAQTAYFMTRTKETLERSKRLEWPYPTYEHGSGELEGLLASEEWKGVADG